MRVASLGLVVLLLAASTGADAALWRRHADRSTATAARSPSSQHVLCHPAAQLSRGLPSLLLASLEPYRPRPRRADLASKLLAANLACFVLVRGRAFPYLAKSNAALRRGQLHRLVSSCFLHGGPLHLAVNCASLRNVGPVVETFFGSERFLATYLGAGISGNLLSWGLGRAPTSVGASGAIFGLVGAWAVFLVRNQRVLEEYGFRNIDAQLKSIMQLSLVNVALGLSPGSRIDNFGHVGGFLGGALASVLFGPRLCKQGSPMRGYLLADCPLLELPKLPPRPRLHGLRQTISPSMTPN